MLKPKAPVNLKKIEYFVATGNYVTAHDKAIKQLKLDVEKHCLRYYADNIVMTELDLIK